MNTDTGQSRKMESSNPVVSIRHLKKSFADAEVLKDINLDLHNEENLVILGRSGTGKSVLIKCMVGLMRPDSGTIMILGYDVFNLDERGMNELRRKVGFSFQGSALYDSMSVRENLEFPLKRNLKISDAAELEHRVTEALRDVGLEKVIDKMPAELSGGMKKRVGIARTLILHPTIMLYDEPTSGLDPITSIEINDLILQMREKYKTSSIIITHDISCAKHTADRVMALVQGNNRIQGTFDEVSRTDDPNLRPFFSY